MNTMSNDELAKAIEQATFNFRTSGSVAPERQLFLDHLRELLSVQLNRAAYEPFVLDVGPIDGGSYGMPCSTN